MVQTITRVILVLDTNHQNRQDGEEKKIPQAHPQNRISLEPLFIRRLVEVIDPRKALHQRSGDLAEDPGEDERQSEEAAVGDPGRGTVTV